MGSYQFNVVTCRNILFVFFCRVELESDIRGTESVLVFDKGMIVYFIFNDDPVRFLHLNSSWIGILFELVLV